MAEDLALHKEQLLGLAEVCHVTFEIDPSGVEPRATFGPASAGDQHIFYDAACLRRSVPSRVILKLRTDPCSTPTNQRLSSSFEKCLPML
jgi:hypothetical protein